MHTNHRRHVRLILIALGLLAVLAMIIALPGPDVPAAASYQFKESISPGAGNVFFNVPPVPHLAVRPVASVAAIVSTAAPSRLILGSLKLHAGTVPQGLSADPGGGWVFSQRSGESVASNDGGMVLTHTTAGGVVNGYMNLTAFGHGGSISAQRIGGVLYVWTEALAVDGYGTAVARIRWQNGATVTSTSPGVIIYRCNAGAPHQTPSLLLPSGLIGVRYESPTLGIMRFAIYRLADFLAHDYSKPLTRISALAGMQGWALTGPASLSILTGAFYSATNPPPGNTQLHFVTDGTPPGIASVPVNTALALPYREPEGLTLLASGKLANAYGVGTTPGNRRTYVYSQ
jgi:hypothetical protein